MNRSWFTADWHLFHGAILRYCNRPFTNVKEMHDALIWRYNQYVGKNDTCYFVGDFAMLRKDQVNKLFPILAQLNGNKILVLGNHDEGKPFTYEKLGFDIVSTACFLPHFPDYVAVHDPAKSIVDETKYFICGHVHQVFLKIKNILNVGVDVWNYYPVSFETVRTYFEKEED